MQEHTYSVLVTVKAPLSRAVRLCWLPALQLVTAAAASKAEQAALASLFPDDDGLYIPSEVAYSAAGRRLTWDAARLDRPYR